MDVSGNGSAKGDGDKQGRRERVEADGGGTTEGLPVAPGMGAAMQQLHIPARPSLMDGRAVWIVVLAVVLGIAAGFIAQLLRWLIALVTNVAFFGRVSVAEASPADAVPHMGGWVVLVPVVGGLIVGLMARYGSKAIRGHGIPEAMENVLTKQSRIPARMTWLKPLSAAIAMGTGGPFGAEGPIIATGGALGSLVGQLVRTTTTERKTLLAAGAAAGMAAIFGSPVSAVLLAVELLLFEFRPRSLIPVALSAAAAAGVRYGLMGAEPAFPMPAIGMQSAGALVVYVTIGAVLGVMATLVTKAVYAVEDGFELLHGIHWMWWPALGAVGVGVIGYFVPLTLGAGYTNITSMLGGGRSVGAGPGAVWSLEFVAVLVVAKFLSWVIALGSGTSGGTMAPLFTMGGGLGLVLGSLANWLVPGAQVDVHVAALVGMAAIFAGASRALLASVVFAFETTLQPMGLLPLLGGCTMSYLVSCVLMRNTIMTEKIERRGVRVPAEYASDFLDQVLVRDVASAQVVALPADQTVAGVRGFLLSQEKGSSHQGFPLVDAAGHLRGVLTRRDMLQPGVAEARTLEGLLRRPPVVVYDDCSLREAADHMVRHDVGRLPVVSRGGPGRPAGKLVGMVTRSDLLRAHRKRIEESQETAEPTVVVPFLSGWMKARGEEE